MNMKTTLWKLLPIFFAVLLAASGAAQTTTISYTATARIDRFDDYSYFLGATGVASHVYDASTGAGTVIYNGTVSELGDSALYHTSHLHGGSRRNFHNRQGCICVVFPLDNHFVAHNADPSEVHGLQ